MITPFDMRKTYQEDHNDEVDPYEEMVSDHERRSGHNPKQDRGYCEMCVVIFNFMVEDGKYCKFPPDSYFEPKTKITRAYCEECELEETNETH